MNASLLVGIYPYIIKLLPAASAETRQSLVAIWTHIIAFDHSCRVDLVKDKHHSSFISWLRTDSSLSVLHRCMASFVLCEICNSFREGQQVCLNSGLHKTIYQLISQPDVLSSAELKKWIVLCVGKLCEDFVLAKYIFVSEVGHLQFHQILVDQCAMVRAAAVSSLGELFGASQGNFTGNSTPNASQPFPSPLRGGLGAGLMPPPANIPGLRHIQSQGALGPAAKPYLNPEDGARPASTGSLSRISNSAAVEQLEIRRSELQLSLHILDRLNDGSAVVRREAVVALSKV